MKLDLSWLVAVNFKSFPALEFDLAAVPAGLHFLRGVNKLDGALGSNGAGKSTVWDAMCWCLYGTTPDGLKGTDVRAWSTTKQTSVCVVVNGKRVMRTAGPNRLTIDEKSCGQDDVDRLVGLNSKTFFHTVVLGQGQPLFFDLPPSEKMKLFSTALELERWDARAEAAKDKVRRLELLQERLATELFTWRHRWDHVLKELKGLEADEAQWSKDQNKRLSEAENAVGEARKRIKALQAQVDDADLAYDGAMMELKLLDKDHDAVMRERNEAHLTWERHDLKMAKLREERDQIDFELGLNPEKCDKCGQPLGDKAYKAMRNKMLDRMDDLDDEIKADKVGPKLKEAIALVVANADRIDATMEGFRQKASSAKAMLDTAGPLLVELKTHVSNKDAIIEEISSQPNPYTAQLQVRRKERQRLHGDIKEHEERLDRLKGQIARTKFWVKGFRDVRLYIVDSLMRELEMATNALLPNMGLPDWLVRYDVERETKAGTTSRGLNVTILSPDNAQPVKWESWSGGERQRLRLVGALAFSDVLLRYSGVQVDMEVLDEPTQHLSAEGVRDLADFLQSRAKELERAIFYVDHQSVDSARFDSVTTVVKDSKGSRLVHSHPHIALAPA